MSTTITIFGATGDLAARLLFPALYRLEQRGLLDDVTLLGTGIEDWTGAAFTAHLTDSVDGDDAPALERLVGRFAYHRVELTPESLAPLAGAMSDLNVHYLALPPGLFPVAATAIADSGMTEVGAHRLVVEKPFGTSGATAAELDAALHHHWTEDQIFRIDHFLGKETVQNLSVMRFANRRQTARRTRSLRVRSPPPDEPEDHARRLLGDGGELEMGISGIGIAGGAGGEIVRLGTPGAEPLRGRAEEEEGGAERVLDRRLDLRPHRPDDPALPADAAGEAIDRLQIVADRLLARNVGQRADDGGDEARAARPPRRRPD